MSNPQISLLTFFWLFALGVWGFRAGRLLLTLKLTPRVINADPAASPKITVLIPAKNEENYIGLCVSSLQKQDYSNYELLVINDNSTDKTEQILKDLKVPYLNCPPAPAGWTGKTHALHIGASRAEGQWLLFTDADTIHEPHSLSAVMRHVEKYELDFLSLLPRCIAETLLEKSVQPVAMGFLGLWFPMERVNHPQTDFYFANGQYILIRRRLYEQLGGHQAVKEAFLEDFALMKKAKVAGARTQCAFGQDIYGTRMYDSFLRIWRGWRRIYLHAFESNPFTLAFKSAGVLAFSFLPFLLFYFHTHLLGVVLAGFVFTIAYFAHRAVKAPGLYAVFHPYAGLMIGLILMDAARKAALKAKTVWR